MSDFGERDVRVLEQIKLGERTWLFYRIFAPSRFAGMINGAYRIEELPGKVEMKVTGAYRDWGPLTITYLDKSALSGIRTLVIHSISGRPWTKEDQESYDFEHNIAPAPRPKP